VARAAVVVVREKNGTEVEVAITARGVVVKRTLSLVSVAPSVSVLNEMLMRVV
jgi:hypothetical protein